MGEPTPRHAAPFYCPYCGEEEIRPWGDKAGEWHCDLCRRVWRLNYVGATGGAEDPSRTDGVNDGAASAATNT